MATTNKVNVRRSLHDLQKDYENGIKKPLEDLMRAWKGIYELDPTDPKSFYCLAGFHGEPFRGAGYGDSSYWGGYCNHGNVLFPTWHRVYLYKLEKALQSIPGCSDVMLPFWDETNAESIAHGIPWALTNATFELDGKTIPNPLVSYTFQHIVKDSIQSDDDLYTKPAGYNTVRYPLSGLVGKDSIEETKKHNALFSNYEDNVKYLNRNIVAWLDNTIILPGGKDHPEGIRRKIGILKEFQDCLEAPNYTVFSNTTSAGKWNEDKTKIVVPLESPHNHIHLSVGGFDVPNQGDFSPIEGANGDMGENNTAGFDPIFYFHHCNVDRMFWLWQKQHDATDSLAIIPEYPGTNSSDSQGATPGTVPNSWLTLETPLNPFKIEGESKERAFMSLDCINIEKQLGYTYGQGSLDDYAPKKLLKSSTPSKILAVSKINRAPMKGSFLVSAFATIEGEKYFLGTESVLSRWNTQYCANCQTHLEVKAFFDLETLPKEIVDKATFDVEIKGREENLPRLKAMAATKKLFHLEIR
jgi:tyrosinase